MGKNELIKTILNSNDIEAEIEKYLNLGEIDYKDILSETQQENLTFLFDNDIYSNASSYARFPLFYRIQDYLNQNNIDLTEYDLKDDAVRITILEDLYRLIIDSKNYSIYTPRILWEIIWSLEPLYSHYKEKNDIKLYYETILDLAFNLYNEYNDFILLDCIAASLQALKDLKYNPEDQTELLYNFKKLNSIYKAISLDHLDFASGYLENLTHLIRLSNKTGNIIDSEKYLNDFINFCKKYYHLKDKSPIPIQRGLLALAPALNKITITGELKSSINELISLINLIVNDKKIAINIKTSLLISLAILSFNLDELENTIHFLVQEAELIEKFSFNREVLDTFTLYYLLKKIQKEIGDNEFEKLIQDLYHVNLDEDLLAALSNNKLRLSNFLDKKALNSFYYKYNQKPSNKETLPDDRLSENPEEGELITYIIYKLHLVQDYIDREDYSIALKQLEEVKKSIENLKKFDDLENYTRYKLEYDLLKRTTYFLTNKANDSDKFINSISDLINSSLQNLNNNEILTPLPTLEVITSTLFENYFTEAGLKLLKLIYQLLNEIPESQENTDLIETYISLLFQLRRILDDEVELDWSEKVIEEFLELLVKQDISPEEYIHNIQFIQEGIVKGRFGLNEDLSSLYTKAIKMLSLYPNADQTPEIVKEIGHTYYIIGENQIDLFQSDEALKSFNKALEYLTRFNITKGNNSQFNSLINTYLNISDIYKQKQDYEKSLETIKKAYQIFNNVIDIIDSNELLYLKLNIFDHYYFLLYQLEEFDEQQKVFEDLLSLLNNDIATLGLIPEVIGCISLFINMNEDKIEKTGNWSFLNYIEDIYNKLIEYRIPSEVENYSPDLQRGILNIYLFYIDYCIEIGKFISEKLLNQTIKLGYELAEIYPKDREDLLRNMKDLELYRKFNLSSNSSYTKKKKVHKKRAKKTAGRNKRRKKKKK